VNLLSLTGSPAVRTSSLGAAVSRVELADGRVVVAKRHDHPTAVRAEVAGLRWLAEPAAVQLPAVLGHDDEWLVLEFVPSGPPASAPGPSGFASGPSGSASGPAASVSGPAASVSGPAGSASAFGRGLAALHAAGASAFGAPPPDGPADAWIGLAPMHNSPGDAWPSWYATHRVLPYLRAAVDRGTLGSTDARAVESVCVRIGELAGPAEPPARLHGDLWSGNVRWAADGRAWLIDPAAHGGHRETDLAMLQLFGCPELDRIVAAYDEAAPLADGWRGRIGLHQLFPLLVHAVLFGGGYGSQAGTAARAALRA